MIDLTDRIASSLSLALRIPADQISLESCLGVTQNWDSLSQMDVIFQLERDFSVEFEGHELQLITDVRSIHSLLLSKLKSP